MARELTFGQAMLKDMLPEDIYQPGMELNKKGIKKVLTQVAQRYPDKYPEIVFKMLRLGLVSGHASGGASFGIKDLSASDDVKQRQEQLSLKMKKILDSMPAGPERRKAIVSMLRQEAVERPEATYQSAKKQGNRFALQLEGAGRGNKGSLSSIRAGDVLAENTSGEGIPVPINRGYSQGQTLSQYYGTSYAGRAGIVDTKLSVGSSGYLSKLLQQAGHRLVVVDDDEQEPTGVMRGLLVDAADEDNVGAILAKDYGEFQAGEVIKPSMLSKLKKVSDEILVRSPVTSSSLDGGLYAKDVGHREFGRLPRKGEHIGLVASQTIGEKVTQAALSSKHGKSVKGEDDSPGLKGFELIERLANPPKEGRGLAIHSHKDGKVKSIRPAPQGGNYVMIADEEHYVPPEFKVLPKVGTEVEAGDVLTNGIVDPAEVTRYKGIGEGRRQLVGSIRRGLSEAGFPTSRRDIEVLSRGLIDRIEFSDEVGEFLPGDVTSYSRFEKLYQPRANARKLELDDATNQYLEQPTLHYTLGTRITPSVKKNLQKVNINEVLASPDPLPFQPKITRAADILQTDDDWMTQFYGSHLQKGFQDAVYRGAESDEDSTSFVPVRARAINLGRTDLTSSNLG